jgi:hypothetical protein
LYSTKSTQLCHTALPKGHVFILGLFHLAPILSSPKLIDNFEVLGIIADSPEARFSCSHHNLARNINQDEYIRALQAYIKTYASNYSPSIMASLINEAISNLPENDNLTKKEKHLLTFFKTWEPKLNEKVNNNKEEVNNNKNEI